MQHVFLTGVTGFIGWHLVRRLLQEQCSIKCLVRPSSDTQWINLPGVELVTGELNEPEGLIKHIEGCDTVMHLAGRVRANDLKTFLQANRDGTKNLAWAASQLSNRPRFVHVSSLAVMGPSKKAVPKTETDTPAPITDYGKSKLEGELALAEKADELSCTIIRPGIVYGQADRMNLEIFKTVKNLGICPIPGWSDRIYSWIHAADLCELLIKAARSDTRIKPNLQDSTGIYFAASNDGIALSEVGRAIGQALGKKRTPAFRCPPVAVLTVSTVYEIIKRTTGKAVPYDWAKAQESMNHWCCSTIKAESELHFTPLASLQERIDQTAQWYRENQWL